MAKLLNEEIQKIYVEIESGDLPDFSKKAADAAKQLEELHKEAERNAKAMATLSAQGKESSEEFVTLSLRALFPTIQKY